MEENNKELTTFVLDDTVYETQLNKKFLKRKAWVKPNDDLLIAVIPGTVKEVFVEEGQTVKAGDKLLILEAMKMLNFLVSPHDAKIKLLNVKAGEAVAKNHLLIELEK